MASSLLGALDVFALLVVPRVIGRGLVPVARHVVYAIGYALAIGLALAAATSAYLDAPGRRAASGAIAPRPRREDAIAYASMAAASLSSAGRSSATTSSTSPAGSRKGAASSPSGIWSRW